MYIFPPSEHPLLKPLSRFSSVVVIQSRMCGWYASTFVQFVPPHLNIAILLWLIRHGSLNQCLGADIYYLVTFPSRSEYLKNLLTLSVREYKFYSNWTVQLVLKSNYSFVICVTIDDRSKTKSVLQKTSPLKHVKNFLPKIVVI